MKRVDLSIVESSAKPGMCSFRLPGQEDSRTATDVRRALSSAGFKPGDDAALVSRAYLEALERLALMAEDVNDRRIQRLLLDVEASR